ncbi:MAG: ribbon-helix-helix domain-containing protein [Proteobacteria bacterium]|jgi:predicted DNA-binding ribbon-helix-helix protein|nr:ribbon-helix-helix domain-containing protein [Pseudomonadota bacterium]MCW5690826.1 ribbon-helix-helix domain-containing protein [Pseudolabrys sp.]
MASARSQVRKRSIVLRGHKTSISLEDAFWDAARDIAVRKGISVGALIEMIDASRNAHNLSSAIRVFVLEDQIKINREGTERR